MYCIFCVKYIVSIETIYKPIVFCKLIFESVKQISIKCLYFNDQSGKFRNRPWL